MHLRRAALYDKLTWSLQRTRLAPTCSIRTGLNLHSVRWRSPPDGPASWNRFILGAEMERCLFDELRDRVHLDDVDVVDGEYP
jgi:hypothetical protein